MDLKILLITGFSITVEIINDSPYYAPSPYQISIDGKVVKHNERRNVFSIFDLKPETNYLVEVKSKDKRGFLNFKTKSISYALNVKKFKAIGDGKHDDTLAIQTAIMACPQDGVVFFPKGTYLVKTLFLKSDISLYLKKGATIIASHNRDDYAILPGVIYNLDSEIVLGSWEGNPLPSYTSLITGLNCKNIRIFGEGILDGNGASGPWWHNPKHKYGAYRPRCIFLNDCENVVIQGVTVQNSPAWTIHPFYCRNLEFYDLKIINPKDAPNTDGCNPESCIEVKMIGLHFSVGDDCIAIKSGKIYMAKHHLQPSSDIEIRNCLMEDGHGGVVFGSEISGGAKNVKVSQCIFSGTDRGLRIKTRRGRGQELIENISFENILMERVKSAFVINMFYFCDPDGKTEYIWSKEPLPVDERTPRLGNFTFRNITVRDVRVSAGFFYGLPESKIEGINLENITVDYAKEEEYDYPAMMSNIDPVTKLGFYFNNINNVNIKNVQIEGQKGEAYHFKNIKKIKNNA